jgi:hypothetical protein
LVVYSFTNTLGMVVVVRQNACGVPVWSGIRHISIIQGLWRWLRRQYQRNIESVCINVNLSDREEVDGWVVVEFVTREVDGEEKETEKRRHTFCVRGSSLSI